MKNNNSNSRSGGIGFFSILFIVFLILKLVHVIDWSWWWVTSPLWIGLIVNVIVILLYYFIIYKK